MPAHARPLVDSENRLLQPVASIGKYHNPLKRHPELAGTLSQSSGCLSPPRALSRLCGESEQALRVEVRDLFLVVHVEGRLFKE
jgi:hypothetical protein